MFRQRRGCCNIDGALHVRPCRHLSPSPIDSRMFIFCCCQNVGGSTPLASKAVRVVAVGKGTRILGKSHNQWVAVINSKNPF